MKASLAVRSAAVALTAAGALSVAAAPAQAEALPAPLGSIDPGSLNHNPNPGPVASVENSAKTSVAAPFVGTYIVYCAVEFMIQRHASGGCMF